MTDAEFLSASTSKVQELIERVRKATAELDDADLNKRTADKWSAGQVLEHVMIGIDYYLPGIKQGISTGIKTARSEIKHSWFGSKIMHGIGPGGNAPVLKKLAPGEGPYKKEIVDRWITRHQEIQGLMKKANGLNLSAIKIANPFFKLFKMNLADSFAILVSHAEGHVVQIEERLRVR